MSDAWPCPKCGGPNLPEDRFCGECGTPRESATPEPSPAARSTISGILPELVDPPGRALEGAPLVLIVALVAAALFGAAYHFVARAREFMILYPILVGLAVGWAIRVTALRSRCRNGMLLLVVAAFGGAGAYALRLGIDTVRERNALYPILVEQARKESLLEGRKVTAELGYFETLLRRSEVGIAIGSGTAQNQNALRGKWFWLLLFVEAALAAGVAAAYVRPISRLAYCARCRRFIPFVPVFRVNARDSGRLVEVIRRQKWKEAQLMSDRASASSTDRAEANLLKCGGCNSSSIRIDLHHGRRFKKVMHVALPPESLEALARSA